MTDRNDRAPERPPEPQPVEVPQPEVRPAEAAEDRSALAFLKVFRHRNYRYSFPASSSR